MAIRHAITTVVLLTLGMLLGYGIGELVYNDGPEIHRYEVLVVESDCGASF